MSFNWTELLDLARLLTEKGSEISANEACLRSAVSRAYFAAFCEARNFARDCENLTITGRAEDHHKIKNHFFSSKDVERREIGNKLHVLRLNRNKADYKDLMRDPGSIAFSSIRQAQRVIDLLSTL